MEEKLNGLRTKKKRMRNHIFAPSHDLVSNRRMGISKSFRKPFSNDINSFVMDVSRPSNNILSRSLRKMFTKLKRTRLKK